MEYFRYTDEDMRRLAERDERLGLIIARYGRIERTVIPDMFEALVNSIVGQQISMKAQETVWNRLCECLGDVTPLHVLEAGEGKLRGCGLSGRKTGYILSAAVAVTSGELRLEELRSLPDEDVIKRLIKLPGVGVWTAEMLLIFSLGRKNVFSARDFGIRRGVSLLYDIPSPDAEYLERLRERYSPLASVASLYLWALSAENK